MSDKERMLEFMLLRTLKPIEVDPDESARITTSFEFFTVSQRLNRTLLEALVAPPDHPKIDREYQKWVQLREQADVDFAASIYERFRLPTALPEVIRSIETNYELLCKARDRTL